MNIGTDVCCAFTEGVSRECADPKHPIAVDLFMKSTIENVKKLALEKIALTGAYGRAL